MILCGRAFASAVSRDAWRCLALPLILRLLLLPLLRLAAAAAAGVLSGLRLACVTVSFVPRARVFVSVSQIWTVTD